MNKVANCLLAIAGIIVSQCIWLIMYMPNAISEFYEKIINVFFLLIPVLCWLISFILRLYNTKKNIYNITKIIVLYLSCLLLAITYIASSLWILAFIGIQSKSLGN
jgi:hypothetical protein